MLKFFTDTDCDVTPELARQLDCQLISMPFSIEGETTWPYRDTDEFDLHAFYDRLRGGVLPNTSALSEQTYLDAFEPHFARGDDILYVHFSRAMTATFDSMDRALAQLRQKYPARRLYEVDTKGITTISYTIFREAADLYRAGKTGGEIEAWAKDAVDRWAMYFFADDLKFFRHSGRVSALAGTMGTVLGIRPIIYMSAEGKMVSVGKEKGRVKAMERLVSTVEALGDAVADHRVVIGHTDCPELARELADKLQERFGGKLDIELRPVNPTAGSHCGPNGVGVCFHAKHR